MRQAGHIAQKTPVKKETKQATRKVGTRATTGCPQERTARTQELAAATRIAATKGPAASRTKDHPPIKAGLEARTGAGYHGRLTLKGPTATIRLANHSASAASNASKTAMSLDTSTA